MKRKLKNFFKRKKSSGQKRRIFASAVLAGNFLFGNLKPNDLRTQNYSNATPLTVILGESNSFDPSYNSGKTIQTGSKYVIKNQNQQNQPSEALKSALKIRSGDLGKGSSPGARAKADAFRNTQAGKFLSRSTIIPGAEGFVPRTTYSMYYPSAGKPTVKVHNPFQANGGNNQPPPGSGQSGNATNYRDGPSPFDNYSYKDPTVVSQNIGFNNPRRLNKSYDKHAKDCFGIGGNRDKENLKMFKGEIEKLAKSANKVYKGSYRYQDPAYIFLKEINKKETAIIVNATDGEYITAINPTHTQMKKLKLYKNIGLDARPTK